MLRRNGNMPKVVGGVVAFFLVVYLVYSLHDLSGQLKNTERTAERYRREQESLSAQLQELTNQKQHLMSTCDHDKEQLKKGLTALQSQQKMLSSQHEDLQQEYSKLKNDNEKAQEMHKKEEEGKESEYRMYKQTKELEISSLKDNVSNLNRDKSELTQQVDNLKTQLQNALSSIKQNKQTVSTLQQEAKQYQDLLQQAQERQKQIEQQQFLLQQQQQLAQKGGQLGQKQGLGLRNTVLHPGGLAPNNPQGFDGLGNQNWNLPNQPIVEGVNMNQGQGVVNQGANLNQGQVNQGAQMFKDGLHQAMQQTQDELGKNNDLKEAPGLQSILDSLRTKARPVDHGLLEQQQQQHQMVPPNKMADKEDNYISRDKLGSQGKPGPQGDKHKVDYPEQHQINKPNLHPQDSVVEDNHGNQGRDPENGAVEHDNRIENQGPVNLQVQEPRLPRADDGQGPGKDEALRFHRPEHGQVDNQMPPQAGLDDSHRQEQMQIPARNNLQDPNLEPHNPNEMGEMGEEDGDNLKSTLKRNHDKDQTVSTMKPNNNEAKSANLKQAYKPIYTSLTDKTKKPKLMQSLRRV
ncbi:putative uncharacterized protein DDB_G0271606 isoform X3 [Dreissena polymorpha]|uniref:putative uncharacterized protein DDB_G0271606 isoform X3 n=1 Tax=Dreissena polymorpha TaxID=45954 RepID=UPI002263DD74|nr:putative uncharacterized protein DDB_G0271606 isoform X3 [Dreissena polymorpha]